MLAIFILCFSTAKAQDQPTVEPPTESPLPTIFSSPIFTGQPPTDTVEELNEITETQVGSIDVPEAERPFEFLSRKAAELEEKTGLRLGFANTMLFQQATGGQGERNGAAGDIDLFAKWTLLGRGTKNYGQFVFAAEYRYQIGSRPPSSLSGEIGTLLGTTNGFTERTMVVKDAYWVQRLFDDRLRIGIGRADPENLVGGHRLQSQNTSFLNKAFSTNPTIAFPGSGAAAAASFRPNEQFYIAAGAANAYGNTTTIEIDELFEEWKLFTFGEIGYTPDFEGLGPGRYRIALWHLDERDKTNTPDDAGFSLIAEQDLNDKWQVFARYGFADEGLAGVEHLAEAGTALKGLLGSVDNLTGLAFAWAEPSESGLRSEKVLEAFHRWQVTAQTQFTLGAQAIIDPSRAPDDDVIGVFSVRLRLSF